MGLFEKIFGRQPASKAAAQTFQTMTAYTPAFTTWGGSIYEAALVRAAVDAIGRHASKLGVTFYGSAKSGLKSRMQQAPNAWQTWSQWLYRTATILYVENTAIIVPMLDSLGDMVGIATVRPSMCELVEYQGTVYLRLTFSTGQKAAVELSRCGIMTRHQYKDDFFGESNSALTPTMEVIHVQNEAIKEGAASAATYRFMARVNNFTDDDDLKEKRKQFNEDNFKSGSPGGLLLFSNIFSDIKQIDSKPFTVDAAQMQLITDNVECYFGCSEKIMKNSANDEEMDAFFNGEIEPFSLQLSQVLTGMIYTERERLLKNSVMMTANRLQYMSVQHKVTLIKELGDRGMLTIDEGRELLNYAPLPDGKGTVAPIRGEYYFANKEDNRHADD